MQAHQGVNPSTFSDADMFAAHTQGGETCVQVFFFRGGQNWGNRPYFPRHDRDLPTAEVLEAFIGQVLTMSGPRPCWSLRLRESFPIRNCFAEALSLRSERKVEVLMPQRGEKRQILDMALQNAREQLGRRQQAENAARSANLLEATAEIAFAYETLPKPHRGLRQFAYGPGHECAGRNDRGGRGGIREKRVP